MAARSCEAVRNKELLIIPESHERTWFDWLENIQDWCISRQLWWGHRIPAYLVTIPGVIDHPDHNKNEHYVVGRTEDEARANAAKKFNVHPGQIKLSQDEDVLDTWFSSGLFPFSTMGWPNCETDDMKAFFPGHLLETGHDIIFFWVARMVMMSLELTDKLPFKTVFLHPMVKDENGAKMSKSKGNVIDPLEVMDGCALETLLKKLYDSNLSQKEIQSGVEDKKKKFPNGIPECGTDALRFALLTYMTQGSINLEVNRVIGYREFCNKLWNIVRFALGNFPAGFQPRLDGVDSIKGNLSLSDKWILTRLSELVANTNKNFEEFKLGDMSTGLYDFWKKELADVYLEATKPVMKGADGAKKEAALNTLYICLDVALKLLHPTMPYITEELYQRLPHALGTASKSISIAPFPTQIINFSAEQIEEKMSELLNTKKALLSQLSALNVASNAKPTVAVQSRDPQLKTMFDQEREVIQSLVKSGETIVLGADDLVPAGCLKGFVSENISVFVKVIGLIDIKLEIARITKRLKQLEELASKLQEKINAPTYTEKVPEKIRADNDAKLAGYQTEIDENLKQLKIMETLNN